MKDKELSVSSGDPGDDCVAMTLFGKLLRTEINRLNNLTGMYDSNKTDEKFLLFVDLVLDGQISPQEALRILETKKITGKRTYDY